MTNSKSKEQIFSSLSQTVTKIEKSNEEYLSGFDINSAFSFLDNEEIRKRNLHAYNKFSVTLKTHIESCEQEIAHLSALICQADNDCNIELTEELVKQFDNYTIFSQSVSHFMKNCEDTFLDRENKFRPLAVANYARELLTATQKYKKSI